MPKEFFQNVTFFQNVAYGTNQAFFTRISHVTFFICINRINPLEPTVKFKQASNHCKRVLEAAKLGYVYKTKEFITSQKVGSWDFWQIANNILRKDTSATPPLFNTPEMLSSASC